MADGEDKPHEIWMYRGLAIGTYSGLEQSLCNLFQALLGTSGNKAGIVFFKITNARARNSILEKLIKDQYGNTFNLFWNSYIKELDATDKLRNAIVHWSTKMTYNAEQMLEAASLTQPNFWSINMESPEIFTKDITAFITKCEILSKLCSYFVIFVCYQRPEMNKDQVHAWLDIFHKALVYPLPVDHLLFQSGQK